MSRIGKTLSEKIKRKKREGKQRELKEGEREEEKRVNGMRDKR